MNEKQQLLKYFAGTFCLAQTLCNVNKKGCLE